MYSEGNPAVTSRRCCHRVRALAEWENMEQKNTEYKNIEQNKKTGYALYDFMTRDMGLSGVALRVYALIYSFTIAGGDCHGSIEYIAERTQSSRTSVKRALQILVTNDFVKKEQALTNQPGIYTALVGTQVQSGPANDEMQVQNDPLTGSKWTGRRSKMDPQ